jgi:hypothetical protein
LKVYIYFDVKNIYIYCTKLVSLDTYVSLSALMRAFGRMDAAYLLAPLCAPQEKNNLFIVFFSGARRARLNHAARSPQPPPWRML